MHVQIVYIQSGRGLLKDCELLRAVLESLGHHVTIRAVTPTAETRLKLKNKWYRFLRKRLPSRLSTTILGFELKLRLLVNGQGAQDLIIHLQSIQPGHLFNNGIHWLIPNQEWFSPDQMHYLQRIDAVVCKTREACALFSQHHHNVLFTGFSSPIIPTGLPAPVKDFQKVLHVAGNSPFKGTDRLISIWRRHPEWPLLTVVSNRHEQEQTPDNIRIASNIPQAELTRLWSESGLAVLPSEVEGYGQVLVEAQAYGCVVITTNAPPMNEVITPECGMLVPCTSTARFRLGTRYFVGENELEQAIKGCFEADQSSLQAMSERASKHATDNHRSFEKNLAALLSVTFADTYPP